MIYFRFRELFLFTGFFLLITIVLAQHDADSLTRILPNSESKAELYNLLAEATIEDSVELSMEYASLALEHAGLENNIREKGVALFSIAEVYAYRFNLDSAIRYYQNALGFLKKADDDYYVSYTLNNLGWINSYYGNYQQAIENYTESVKYLDLEEHPDELPHVYINIGTAYHHLGSYYTAIDYFRKAVLLIRNVQDKTALPIAYNQMGLAWKYLGNFDSAIFYYDRMLEIDKKNSSALDVAIDLGNIGALYYEWGHYRQSYNFHQEALNIYLKEGNKNNISVAYNNLGEVFYSMGQYDSSLYYLQKALEIDRETGMEHNMAHRYNNIGDIYFKQQQFDKALMHYNLALNINTRREIPFNIVLNKKNIARVMQAKNQFGKAEMLFLESLEKAKEIESKSLQSSVLESLSEFYAASEKFSKAYAYHLLYDEMKDSIFREKTQKQLADLQTRYELDKKENEITILNSENQRRINEARQYRSSVIILGAALLVISGLLIILFIQFNLRKKAYKKLVQKNLELAKTPKAPHVIDSNVKDSIPEYTASIIDNDNHKELRHKLKIYLKKEKPYLQSDLSAKELASQLETNTHYLSEVINREFGTNFTGFINEYRVKEACKLLADEDKQNLTIESIAHEAGFNSKSAFNNAFKSVTGLTPSYYRKSVNYN